MKLLPDIIVTDTVDRIPIIVSQQSGAQLLRVPKLPSGTGKIKNVRQDYKELLQLILVFLGADSQSNISFRMSGPIHHARWMATA